MIQGQHVTEQAGPDATILSKDDDKLDRDQQDPEMKLELPSCAQQTGVHAPVLPVQHAKA